MIFGTRDYTRPEKKKIVSIRFNITVFEYQISSSCFIILITNFVFTLIFIMLLK